MKPFKKITLKNGLRVILAPKTKSPATTVLVMVSTGSKYEEKKNNGISHFLEHLVFKGTTNRPTAIQISSELDSLGAKYNAFTGEEYTGYYAKTASKHTGKALDIVADMYLNPTFPTEEIEKEKGVIIEELNMYEDLPMRRVHEIMTELLYGNQPAGWPIGGKKEIIQNMKRPEIVKYRDQHYVAGATVVVVSGGFNESRVLDQIKKTFGSISTSKKYGKVKTRETQKSPTIKTQFKKTDQSHLVIAVRAYDIFDKRRYALGLLADILGGSMSSRLFENIRNKLGAAYYIRAGVEAHTDHGYLSISAGVDNKKLDAVIKAILSECSSIKSGLVTDEEITRAKNHAVGNLMIGLETSDELAMFYGGQEVLREKIATLDEITKKLSAVTKKEIVNVAKDIFKNSKLNLALIGPVKNTAPLKKILKF
jgi:predicted Zn-dependent peptidase